MSKIKGVAGLDLSTVRRARARYFAADITDSDRQAHFTHLFCDKLDERRCRKKTWPSDPHVAQHTFTIHQLHMLIGHPLAVSAQPFEIEPPFDN